VNDAVSEISFKCDLCDKAYATNNGLVYHRAKHHKDPNTTDGGSFCCLPCGLSFQNGAEFAKHQRISPGCKMPPKKLPCPKCDKEFSTKNALRWGVRTALPQ
jgi:hypothetical protein